MLICKATQTVLDKKIVIKNNDSIKFMMPKVFNAPLG